MFTRKQFTLPEVPVEERLSYVEKLKRAILDILRDLNIPGSLYITQTPIANCTIDDTAIGSTTPNSGKFTTMEWTGNAIIGDNAADTINFKSAAWTFTNSPTVTGTWANLGSVTTCDINGGAIDGTVIGGASAAAGTFTTLTSTGNTVLGDASTDTLNVGNGGIIKDASGNVGIGVAPSARLHAAQANTGGDASFIFGNAADAYTNLASTTSLYLGATYSGLTTISCVIRASHSDGTTGNHAQNLQFWTVDPGSTPTQQLTLTSDGRLYGTSLHNNAGAVTGTTNQYIASGTATPTATGVTNVTTTASSNAQWLRVGNCVTVSGYLAIDTTAAGTTNLRIALPIASALAAVHDLIGVATVDEGGMLFQQCVCYADTTNDAAYFAFTVSASASVTLRYHYTYEVL